MRLCFLPLLSAALLPLATPRVAAAAVSAANATPTAAWLAALPAPPASAPLPPVPPVDLGQLRPEAFSDEELDLPYYLQHFATVINAVVDHGPLRGFHGLSVWRTQRNHRAYNARIMENILSFAYFYSLDRPWNPYRGHPAVRARLEAALDYWCRIQAPDGQFSEYGERDWNLAATAFATKFMSEALWCLRNAPPLDAAVLARAIAANRAAIRATLTIPSLYAHGRAFTNQYGNVWGGGLAFFALYPDPALRQLWEERLHQSRADFQSPAGFYYEANGPDFGYTMSTHNFNCRQAWPFLRGTSLADEFLQKETAWYGWLAYNATPEPEGSGFALNRAIESRQSHADFITHDTPLGEFIPLARAYAESREERQARLQRERAALVAAWPKVAPLAPGEMWTYSPYAFLLRRATEWRPTTAERDAARRLLPMLARDRFVHQRTDPRQSVVYTFVRRPAYYATFTSGRKATAQQTYGLGLLWHPRLGAVLQSQSRSDAAAWGTRPAGITAACESADFTARYLLDGHRPVSPSLLPSDLPPGELSVLYPLGPTGEKTVSFGETGVVVAVRQAGAFSEQIPLLVPAGGRVQLAADRALLVTPQGSVEVRFGRGVQATLDDTPQPMLAKHIVVLHLQARDALDYRIDLPRP